MLHTLNTFSVYAGKSSCIASSTKSLVLLF